MLLNDLSTPSSTSTLASSTRVSTQYSALKYSSTQVLVRQVELDTVEERSNSLGI
jgi:hypothetical protein